MPYETPKSGVNRFTFSGKVERKSFKYSENGNAFASVMIRIPAKNPKFSTTLWLKAFKDAAEAIENGNEVGVKVEEGGEYAFFGYVSNNKYKDEWRTDFVINKFVAADPQEQTQEQPQEPVAVSASPNPDGDDPGF